MTHTSSTRGRAASTAARPGLRPLVRGALATLAAALSLTALAPAALAGPPNHARAEAFDIAGFNHACGTAVDTAGNVYVSSAGDDEIVVFDPDHQELTSIANVNEPCGLAVDSHGTLFVTERGTGKVVRYVPDEQPPFTGTPSYGSAEEVDGSGDAAGIAVDGTEIISGSEYSTGYDDTLFIAKGDHIGAYRNERQRVSLGGAGTATIQFEGDDTELSCGASHQDVQEALEGLSTIGAGNVSVTTGNFLATDHLIAFVGALGQANVSALNLSGACGFLQKESDGGPTAPLAEDPAADYTGVAAYTYQNTSESFFHYLYAADAEGDQVEVLSGPSLAGLEHRRTVTGVDLDEDGGIDSAEELVFGAAGAYLAVDRGNTLPGGFEADLATGKCVKVGKQACAAGHLLVYNADPAGQAVVEFDATGRFLDLIESDEFADAEPTGLAIDRSGGSTDGRIYVTAGAGPGAKLLAFKPLAAPGRSLLDGTPAGEPALSRVLTGASVVTTDAFGNVYVASGPTVHIFGPDGKPVTTFEDARGPYDIDVDSECNVYVADGAGGDKTVTYYEASACPPSSGTSFSRRAPSLLGPGQSREAIAVNPANDHLFVVRGIEESPKPIVEFDSAEDGSAELRECGGVISSSFIDMAVYGGEGESKTTVYLIQSPSRLINLDCGAAEGQEEILAETNNGAGCANGAIGGNPAIAVDQSNGHLLVSRPGQAGGVREYDAALSCVAEFGTFGSNPAIGCCGIAIDNGIDSPNRGVVYVAADGKDNTLQPFDLTAFGQLSYGATPIAETGKADGVNGGAATLNGAVNPRGAKLESCEFEYLLDSEYEQNLEESKEGFDGAASSPCAEGAEEIGDGEVSVDVHADLAGLVSGERYRFRLRAENEFGQSVGNTWLFGPPEAEGERALPVFYDEATLRASVDSSGLETEYRFEYGTTAAYGQSTPAIALPAGDGKVAIEVPVGGLAQGAEYHFRLRASNEAGEYLGADQTFETQQRLEIRSCPNVQYRLGLSAKLPDCRAYELVTPADTRASEPGATLGSNFNNALIKPRGSGAGEVLTYFSGTLAGFEGTGDVDAYRARRGPGAHPGAGWGTELASPTYAEYGIEAAPGNNQEGVAADQLHSLWFVDASATQGTLAPGRLLRTPQGFELLGRGRLGADPAARGDFLSADGGHVVFSSSVQLEEAAAPDGIRSVYDRNAGEAVAEVVSLDPDGNPFGADAAYAGASEDGSTVLFEVAGGLYAHRGGETTEVIAAPNSFAGVSADGSRVYYTDGAFLPQLPTGPADLFACDLDGAGPCPAPGEELAPETIPVGISADGSGAYFVSEEVLSGEESDNGEEALAGEPNLYAYDGALTRFVGILDPDDFKGFGFEQVPGGGTGINLRNWTKSINPGQSLGRANTPTRATPDGEVFLFQSHADLTAQDNGGRAQIYRFAPGAPIGERLICVSCDPTGAPASADAMLQIYAGQTGGKTLATTVIPNITDDGTAVFFHSPDRLLPEDANAVIDVYQWRARGAGVGSEECRRLVGCLSLISSGQGEGQSVLYGMSADGRDVFFSTREKLVGADLAGSSSIYDARVEGGIPDPPAAAPCQGDACQGQGATPPALPAPASAAVPGGGNASPAARARARCPKGKRKVRRKGKVRCAKRQGKKRARAKQQRANRNRGASR